MDNNDKEQLQGLVNRFIAVYNRIEGHLRDSADGEEGASFRDLVYFHRDRRLLGSISPTRLFTAAELRNALSHGQTKPGHYPAYPSLEFVQELETMARRLIEAPLITSRCKQKVEVAESTERLKVLFGRMSQKKISQFPAYSGAQFTGLITETGIARWVSGCVCRGDTIDFAEATVGDVLAVDAEPSAYKFVPEKMTEQQVMGLFAVHPLLEAVLVTKQGEPTEITGIVTRWDLPCLMSTFEEAA